jgi:hypothetical protein
MVAPMLVSIHEGILPLGTTRLECHVLNNGMRIFSSRDFLRAFGLQFEPKEESKYLRAFIDKVKIASTENTALYNVLFHPIKFKKGNTGGNFPCNGYPAELLSDICNIVLATAENKLLGLEPELKTAAKQARKLLKSLANVGVIALIDEATGYQDYRDKRSLQDLLDKYLKKEYAAWAKRFPDAFYQEMFRLKKWEWRGMRENRPGVVGKYTNDIVYNRLAPGILEELEKRNPPTDTGRQKVKHHQWLTEDIGHPALAEHLSGVLAIMKLSNNWDAFRRNLTKVYPVLGEQHNLELDEDV